MRKAYLIILVLFLAACQPQAQPSGPEVCFEDTCFGVEVADTEQERRKGLMFREELARDKGMLFVWEEPGNYPFWMKNTKISLDMIWVNSEKEVVHVQHEAQPCNKDSCRSYNPNATARYVLEVNGGVASEEGISEGDKVDIRI